MGLRWIDEKYLLQLSSRLERFKQVGDVFQHRCPFCGDSQKSKYKARGYHFLKENSYIYKCHNCGLCFSTGKFIEKLDFDLYKQYRRELYKELHGNKRRRRKLKLVEDKKENKPTSLLDMILDNVKTLPEEHQAVQLLRERMIPESHWDNLYFIDDMRKIGQLSEKYKEKLKVSESRLLIAIRDRNQKVVGLSCRSFEKEAKLRYITIKIDEDAPMIYGLERVNMNKKIYVFEGAFDSMFIKNSVAVSGSNLKMIDKYLPKENVVLIFDCQPRNKQLVKQINTAIKQNFTVSLLPETGYKDINLMVQNGYTPDKILNMIKENSCRGVRAKMKFNQWKKIK